MLEFAIKHVGIGVVGYWREPWNILDGLIVVRGGPCMRAGWKLLAPSTITALVGAGLRRAKQVA